MNVSVPLNIALTLSILCMSLPGCHQAEGHAVEGAQHGDSHAEGHGGHHEAARKIVVTSPVVKDVISTQEYVCQIHSCRHIEVRTLESGYLEEICTREGQSVKQGDLLFKIYPVLFKAKLDSELAEAELARLKVNNTQRLVDENVVSKQELALSRAELAKVQAKAELAQAELNFTDVKAPFDGIIDRQRNQQGSLLEEGDILTTLSDNSVMWVYFNVPESRYLEYKANLEHNKDELQIELMLANGTIFESPGKIGAIEADFNNETGNIAFRADFENPKHLLRHGQTGTVLIHRKLHDAVVIPQRATFEILAKRYVYVVSNDDDAVNDDAVDGDHDGHHSDHDQTKDAADHHNGVVRQREIEVESVLDDIYIIRSGVEVNDKIVLEGVRQVRDGDKVEFEYRAPEEVLSNLKYTAE